ncbi:MAG: hypothetical protein ACTHJP_00570 [Rhodanobacteraceae bacterium]
MATSFNETPIIDDRTAFVKSQGRKPVLVPGRANRQNSGTIQRSRDDGRSHSFREKSGQEARSGGWRYATVKAALPFNEAAIMDDRPHMESPGRAGANAKAFARDLPALGIAGRAGLWL